MQTLEPILLNQIIPSIYDAAITLALVLALFSIFAIKNPATRFTFLFLPLIKPCIVLFESTSSAMRLHKDRLLQPGVRFPDPFGFISLKKIGPLQEIGTMDYDHAALVVAVYAAIVVICILLLARWLQLFLFLNSFKKEEPIEKSEYPQLYEILDSLVAEFGHKYPD